MNQLDTQIDSGYLQVADVGAGGLRMYSPERLDPNEQIALELDLFDGQTLKCTGQVIWQKSLGSDGPAQYDVGVEFIKLSNSDREKLDAFLSAH